MRRTTPGKTHQNGLNARTLTPMGGSGRAARSIRTWLRFYLPAAALAQMLEVAADEAADAAILTVALPESPAAASSEIAVRSASIISFGLPT